MEFALDPALLGVAGPSTSAAGRVRAFPSLLEQHERERAARLAEQSKAAPLLSDDEGSQSSSGSSSAGGSASSSSGDDEDDTSEDEDKVEEESTTTRLDKGKGRAVEPQMPSYQIPPTLMAGLPPLPTSTSNPLPPIYPETDGELDYATDTQGGGSNRVSVYILGTCAQSR